MISFSHHVHSQSAHLGLCIEWCSLLLWRALKSSLRSGLWFASTQPMKLGCGSGGTRWGRSSVRGQSCFLGYNSSTLCPTAAAALIRLPLLLLLCLKLYKSHLSSLLPLSVFYQLVHLFFFFFWSSPPLCVLCVTQTGHKQMSALRSLDLPSVFLPAVASLLLSLGTQLVFALIVRSALRCLHMRFSTVQNSWLIGAWGDRRQCCKEATRLHPLHDVKIRQCWELLQQFCPWMCRHLFTFFENRTFFLLFIVLPMSGCC